MDITKINFSEAKYGISFEELDLNSDNVINESDLELATDNNIKNTITNALADVDEESGVNDNQESTETTGVPTAKTAEEITAKAEELKSTYTGGQDIEQLNKLIQDGVIAKLNQEGFDAKNIIDIISQAFPNAGISNNEDGSYNCPKGASTTQDIYNAFIEEMNKVKSPEVMALEAKVKEMNKEITQNNLQLNNLKGSITALQEEIEREISKAIDETEEIEEDQKNEAAEIVKEELNKYTNSEGEMSYDVFETNLSGRLNELDNSGNGKLSSIINRMMNAENRMSTLKSYMTSFETLINANKSLSDKITTTEKDIKTCAAASSCEPKRCDPIGFESNGNRYDFFVDNDSNGKLSNETEFLGAKNGWQEMAALDVNNDNKVTADEMKDLKVVVTDASGNQTVENASNLFAATDSIDLNSYQAVNKDFANGNTLLGTFSLDFNGEKIDDAYNTLDTLDWLDANYQFSDAEEGINRFAQGRTNYETIADYSADYSTFSAKYTELDTKMNDAWSKLNITRNEISESINNAFATKNSEKVTEIENLFSKKEVTEEEEKKEEQVEV